MRILAHSDTNLVAAGEVGAYGSDSNYYYGDAAIAREPGLQQMPFGLGDLVLGILGAVEMIRQATSRQ